jgi:hypothetical protein
MSAPPDTQSPLLTVWHRLLPVRLLDLTSDPAETFPALLTRQGALRLLVFPAASGVFAAYTVAKALALGDRFGFAPTLALALVLGTVAGVGALFFMGELAGRHSARYWRAGGERAWLHIVFSYATWPFLPLLFLVAGLELLFQGTLVFSAARPPLPADFVWAIRVLILATLVIWAVLMIGGTAVVRKQSEPHAAREVGRWLVTLGAIALLISILVAASLRVW